MARTWAGKRVLVAGASSRHGLTRGIVSRRAHEVAASVEFMSELYEADALH